MQSEHAHASDLSFSDGEILGHCQARLTKGYNAFAPQVKESFDTIPGGRASRPF
jgi:hypothetical protein